MMKLRTILVGAALAAAVTLTAGAEAPKSVKDIRECMAKNLVARGALRDLSLGIYDKEGKVRDLRLRLFWKPSKTGGMRVNLRILEPPAMHGSSYLLLQSGRDEEVYFALPGADRALRVTGQNMSEPLWGTDFSYGEIKQVLGLLWLGDTKRLQDAKVGDRAAYVLSTETLFEESGYTRVVSYVDQQSCVLTKSEFFAKADKPRKELDADLTTLTQADKYWTVLGYTMKDLTKGTHTQLTLTDLSFDERMSEKLFDPKKFYDAKE